MYVKSNKIKQYNILACWNMNVFLFSREAESLTIFSLQSQRTRKVVLGCAITCLVSFTCSLSEAATSEIPSHPQFSNQTDVLRQENIKPFNKSTSSHHFLLIPLFFEIATFTNHYSSSRYATICSQCFQVIVKTPSPPISVAFLTRNQE